VAIVELSVKAPIEARHQPDSPRFIATSLRSRLENLCSHIKILCSRFKILRSR
jgi:hypothetical protein